MTSKSVVDSRLFIRLDLGRCQQINSFFVRDPANAAHLASQLLLYDTVIIPTTDFGIVPILISWLGLDHFKAALKSSAIGFVRRVGLLGYAGNGNGISAFVIRPGEKRPWRKWWHEAMFGESRRSLDLQLSNISPSIPVKEREKFVDAIISSTTTLRYDNDLFMRSIVHESYVDVMSSPRLSKFVLEKAKKKNGAVDLAWLEEVAPNEMRVLRHHRAIKDAVDLVLRVAEINMEILMSSQSDDADLFTSQGAELILTEKLARAGLDRSLLQGFIRLLELTDIPDIRAAVSSNALTLSDIWKIRQGTNARRFREWLREADPSDSRDLEKAYVQALGRSTLAESLPLRALRFALTTAVGILRPDIGLVAGAIDSFFVDKWLKGYSPKLFFDELQRLSVEK